MSDFISALSNSTTGLSASSFINVLVAFVPWLVIMIPLSFGIALIYKLISSAQKGSALGGSSPVDDKWTDDAWIDDPFADLMHRRGPDD